MNFQDFETFVKTHKVTSVLLIVLFLFGIIFQVTDAYTKITGFFTPEIKPPLVKSLEVARGKTVYVEYGKLDKESKETIKPTQLNYLETGNREFVYNSLLIDRLWGSRESLEIVKFANAIINYGLDSGLISPSQEEYVLLHMLVQKRNIMNLEEYLYNEVLPKERFLKQTGYMQASNRNVSLLLESLSSLETDDGVSYKMGFKRVGDGVVDRYVSRGEMEALIDKYSSTIRNQFEPVFEVTLFNPNDSEILITEIGVSVVEVEEYKGIGEKPSRSDILTFLLPTEPGAVNKDIDDLSIKAKSHLKLFLRLESQRNFSTYRLKFDFNWGEGGIVSTEEILVDV